MSKLLRLLVFNENKSEWVSELEFVVNADVEGDVSESLVDIDESNQYLSSGILEDDSDDDVSEDSVYLTDAMLDSLLSESDL